MQDCVVPANQMLGKEGQGFTIAMQGLDGGRVSIGKFFFLERDFMGNVWILEGCIDNES